MSEAVTENAPAQDDDPLDRALRGSIGGRVASRAATGLSSAWRSSISRTYFSAGLTNWRTLPASTRVRMIAVVGAVAALVHLVMARQGPAEPLGAVVPLVILLVCAAADLLADWIARVAERYER